MDVRPGKVGAIPGTHYLIIDMSVPDKVDAYPNAPNESYDNDEDGRVQQSAGVGPS